MLESMEKFTESNTKFSTKELMILGNAVESEYNKIAEWLQPVYDGCTEKVMHPYVLVDNLCLGYGQVIDFSNMSSIIYTRLSNWCHLLDALSDYNLVSLGTREPDMLTLHFLYGDNVCPFVKDWFQGELEHWWGKDFTWSRFADHCVKEFERIRDGLMYQEGLVTISEE